MKKFNLVLLQDVKKGDVINTRELKAPLTIKKNESPLDKAIEITRLLSITRNEQLIRGSKFVTPFNLGATFRIAIEIDNKILSYKGMGLFSNEEIVKLSFAVKEQISKGEVVATKCEVFTKRAELIAKQIYLTLCDALEIPHGLTIESSNEIGKLVSNNTRKLLK